MIFKYLQSDSMIFNDIQCLMFIMFCILPSRLMIPSPDAVLLHLDLTLLAGDASDGLARSKDEHLVVLLALFHNGLHGHVETKRAVCWFIDGLADCFYV